MSQQGLRQASVRTVTGTTYDYNGDWSALFTAYGLTTGDFNGRLLAWINISLGTAYTELNGAMQAFAEANNAYNWSSMGTFYPNPLYAYGVPAFLFDVPLSQYKNGSSFSTSFSSLTGLTFTRALAAYAPNSAGVLELFASGAPRITDRGLLIEGARTNLCLRSQEFDNASWTKVRASASANAINAPDGTLTADALLEDGTAANNHRFVQTIVKAASAITYTLSCYYKKGARDYAVLYAEDAGGTARAYFNLTNGTISSAAAVTGTWASPSATITALADGWYYCTLTYTTGTSAYQDLFLLPSADGTTLNFNGVNGQTATYLWGSQIEAAAFPSSYIPTTSASVARPADVCSIAVSGISYPATLFAEFEATNTSGSTVVAVGVENAGTNNDCVRVGISSTGAAGRYDVRSNNIAQAGANVGTVAAVTRMAARVALNNVNAATLGTLGTADTLADLPITASRINMGYSNQSGLYLFGFIKRAAVWNGGFMDSQLTGVTS